MKTRRFANLTAIVLLLALGTAATAEPPYTNKLTSGPFLIAPNAQSLDWTVVNNDTVPVHLPITVFKLQLDMPKVATAPGPLTIYLAPGASTHNANGVGSVFQLGFAYEVVVESDSDKVNPNVTQWSNASAQYFIPGTLIPSGSFVNITPAASARPPR